MSNDIPLNKYPLLFDFVERCFKGGFPPPDKPAPGGWVRNMRPLITALGRYGAPRDGGTRHHGGIDIQWGGRGNDPTHAMRDAVVIAPFDGWVTVECKRDKNGRRVGPITAVTITDGDGRFVVFRHLDRIAKSLEPETVMGKKWKMERGKRVLVDARVTLEARITKGTEIGHVGTVGCGDCAVHLHLEVGFVEGYAPPRPDKPLADAPKYERLWDPVLWVPFSDYLDLGFGRRRDYSSDATNNWAAPAGAGAPLLPMSPPADGDWDWQAAVAAGNRDPNISMSPPSGPCEDEPDPPHCTPPPPARVDPLILNLDDKGIRTVGLDAGIHFDNDGNGFKEVSGWVGLGSGVLMLDRNGNDTLDDGTELFSDFTRLPNGMRAANGFQALAQYDANHDGKIDANDPIWSQLRIWQYDEYNDGGYYDDPDLMGTITTLDDLGITAIYLDSQSTSITDASGNTLVRGGHFQWDDGSTGTMGEYRMQRDTLHSVPMEELEVPPEILDLPDVQGYGDVYSLHQAMVRDTSGQLKALVEAFASEPDRANREAILDQIFIKWAGTDSVAPDVPGVAMDGRKLAALEKFYGNPPMDTLSGTAVFTDEVYRGLFETFYSSLMSQTHFADFFDVLGDDFDPETGEFHAGRGLALTIAEFKNRLDADPDQGSIDLSEFARSWRGLQSDNTSDYLSFREAFIQQDPDLGWVIDSGGLPVIDHLGQGGIHQSPHMVGTNGSDAIRGSLTEGDGLITGMNGNDVIYGTDRNETLWNDEGNAVLVGGGGNDVIWAGPGNDTLDGGPGNDCLVGEAGNDTYIFRRGSGQDSIVDADASFDNIDTIWLGSNLTPADVILRSNGNDLVLKIIDTSDSLTVRSFFRVEDLYPIERIQFMDGTVWTGSDIVLQTTAPTEWDDIIWGGAENDDLRGLGGSDDLHGQGGDDTLRGDAGSDRLYGWTGNDILEGGEGCDVRKAANSLIEHWQGLFTFLEYQGVEPTNNSAESALRPAVQWRKICFGNQSDDGELLTARLLTAERSCIRQGRNAFHFLVQSVVAHRTGLPGPALI